MKNKKQLIQLGKLFLFLSGSFLVAAQPSEGQLPLIKEQQASFSAKNEKAIKAPKLSSNRTEYLAARCLTILGIGGHIITDCATQIVNPADLSLSIAAQVVSAGCILWGVSATLFLAGRDIKQLQQLTKEQQYPTALQKQDNSCLTGEQLHTEASIEDLA